MLIRLIESLDWLLRYAYAYCVGGESHKGTVVPANASILEIVAPTPASLTLAMMIVISSPYDPGDFQAAASVLELRVSELVSKLIYVLAL